MAEYKGINLNEDWVKSFKDAADFAENVHVDTKAAWSELFGITPDDLPKMYKLVVPDKPKGNAGATAPAQG